MRRQASGLGGFRVEGLEYLLAVSREGKDC